MDSNSLRSLVSDALRRIIVDEWDLAVVDAHERTITSHLSRLITDIGVEPQLRVDHEYGRHSKDPKRVQLGLLTDDSSYEDEHQVIPDIVIHRRGSDADSLLVIEAKKTRGDDSHDALKVRALLDQLHYRACVLLSFGIEQRGENSRWNPSWCWMSDSNEPIAYETVFEPDECARLNDEGKHQWRQRL